MNKSVIVAALVVGAVLLGGVLLASPNGSTREPAGETLYPSSVVGTEFDFITEADPSAFERIEYRGFEAFEMPDKRPTGEPLVQEAYMFRAYFTEGTTIDFALDKRFGSREAAEKDVARYMPMAGRLPKLYRRKIRHVVVHRGGEETTAFAEDKGHFFVIYSGNATKRIRTHDLEETFFHESTHASIQADHVNGQAWSRAKSLDKAYITEYARTDDQEDFAESALFAYTLLYHPERLPAEDREKVQKQIPNRLAFFKKLFASPS